MKRKNPSWEESIFLVQGGGLSPYRLLEYRTENPDALPVEAVEALAVAPLALAALKRHGRVLVAFPCGGAA